MPGNDSPVRTARAAEPLVGEARAPKGRPPVVMADVAKAAGVSKQTVSRVLNDQPNVSDEKRDRVLAAVRELGYSMNATARALATGRTATIGVITFDLLRYGPAKVLQGIGHAADEAGYMLSVVPLRSLDRRSVLEAIERLVDRSVDGLITIAPQHDMARALLRMPHKVPMVALDDTFDNQVPVVTPDEEGGARQATEHLLQLGHRTVWHIAGPGDSIAAEGRIRGWRDALEAAGAPVPDPLVGDWEADSGYRLGLELARRSEVTAVFAANDQMALGLLRALHESGRRVPQDVSVIGFDDLPDAAHLIPPLSTIRPDFTETGRRCITILLDQMQTGRPPRLMRSIVPVDLIIRRSVATAPRA